MGLIWTCRDTQGWRGQVDECGFLGGRKGDRGEGLKGLEGKEGKEEDEEERRVGERRAREKGGTGERKGDG